MIKLEAEITLPNNKIIYLNKRNLVDLSFSVFDRSDIELPSYGIISNGGKVTFRDFQENGVWQILEYAETHALREKGKIEVYIQNSLYSATRKRVGVFNTEKWDYDNDNNRVSLSFSDDLQEWQNIHIDGFQYDPRNPFKIIEKGYMSNLYIWLHSNTPKKYNMLSFEDLDLQTRAVLLDGMNVLNYPFLKADNLWAQWTKLCNACGLHIFKDISGNTVCRSTRGS